MNPARGEKREENPAKNFPKAAWIRSKAVRIFQNWEKKPSVLISGFSVMVQFEPSGGTYGGARFCRAVTTDGERVATVAGGHSSGSTDSGSNERRSGGIDRFFVNTLVMRTDLSEDPSVSELLGAGEKGEPGSLWAPGPTFRDSDQGVTAGTGFRLVAKSNSDSDGGRERCPQRAAARKHRTLELFDVLPAR